MGHWLDGRVSVVFGTHTHVPTADAKILPGGSAFISDLGMCGPYDSVLGRRKDRVLKYMTTNMPVPFDVATGDVRMCGLLAEVDPETGRALSVERIEVKGDNADQAYDAALEQFLDGIYGDRDLMADVEKLANEIAPHGDKNSLAQLLIKLTAPGVPDFYQGTELRDDSLVDPDNRRPVDLAARREKLRTINDATASAVVGDLGAMKLLTIRRVLGLRRKHPQRFVGAYKALDASGPHAHRVFAFSRGADLVTITPRLTVRAEGWRDTTVELPDGTWIDVLSDQQYSGGKRTVAELWRGFPISLLTRTQ
jgi:maltooligosyltrehalose synthase